MLLSDPNNLENSYEEKQRYFSTMDILDFKNFTNHIRKFDTLHTMKFYSKVKPPHHKKRRFFIMPKCDFFRAICAF